MLKVTTNAEQVSLRLGRWAAKVGPGGRRQLYSDATNAVGILVRGYLSRLGSWKHTTAARLGAQPTGILEKASTRTTWHATSEYGEVVIPTPAVSRAFHDVEIRPRSGTYLTIPASSTSYGRSVAAVAGLGWKIYRPGKARVLMGKLGDDEPKLLYYLVTSVHQRQDRSLLPSDEAMKQSAAGAMLALIRMASIRRAS